jgi:hypothetical protein
VSGRFERHARSRTDWDTQPSRSAERQAAAGEPERQAPGRKDRRAHCKENAGGPHVPAVVFMAAVFRPDRGCEWMPSWSRKERGYDGAGWYCRHEEHCSRCGKVLRVTVTDNECPAYPGNPVQRADAEADALRAQERQDAWRQRKRKIITGPQGYRRKRAGA